MAIGELDVSVLLRDLKVSLHPSTFVFITVPKDISTDNNNPDTRPATQMTLYNIPVSLIQMTFQEPREGLSLILDQAVAEQYHVPSSQWTFKSRMITLDVHSSLEAVGFMAVIAGVLAKEGIGCNPVSGYYHDHLFVPEDRADDAVRALEEASVQANQPEV